MKVLIAGTGGVGGYFGARLCQAGHDVWFLARGDNLRALRDHGLQVTSPHGDVLLAPVNATASGDEAGLVDAVLFCVKTYDNGSAAAAISGAVGPGTAVCSLQNGVENERFLAERFPRAMVLGAAARVEAWVEGPGVVMQKGPLQAIDLGGFRREDRQAAEALAAAFEGTGVPVQVHDEVEAVLWLKLLGICGVGGITAFGRCTIGEARQDPQLRRIMAGAFEEVEAVARARDVALLENAAATVLMYVENVLDPTLKSSMLRDLQRGRPLEVEALNGAVVRFGREVGVAAPNNQRILKALLPLHEEAVAARRGASGLPLITSPEDRVSPL